MTRAQLPALTVRDAAAGDFAAVTDLVRAAGLPLDGLVDSAAVLVAEAGGGVVGTVALERHGAGAATAFLLRSAAVDAAWHGRGVGTALTRAALDVVDAGRAPVALLTETADGYFPRFGFARVAVEGLPAALTASAELRGACPASARAFLRAASVTNAGPRSHCKTDPS